jgi:hypothetical protein
MDIEVAGIGDQVNQTALDQRHDGEEETDGLKKLLAVGPWVFDWAKFLSDRSGM